MGAATFMADVPFNGLSPAQAERLDMLAEEAAEIIVAVSKIKRHGPYSYNPDAPGDGSNVDQLNRELADFEGVLHGMALAGDPYLSARRSETLDAWERKLRYAHHQDGDGD